MTNYSNADFLDRVQRNKANRLNYLEQKKQITTKQIKPSEYIPPDPRIKDNRKMMNKTQVIAYRESKLNQGLGRFI